MSEKVSQNFKEGFYKTAGVSTKNLIKMIKNRHKQYGEKVTSKEIKGYLNSRMSKGLSKREAKRDIVNRVQTTSPNKNRVKDIGAEFRRRVESKK